MPKPTPRFKIHPTHRRRTPLLLSVITRDVFAIDNPELAADIRQALRDHDIERIAELVDYLFADGMPSENGVLEVSEAK